MHLRNYDTSITSCYLLGAYYTPDTVITLSRHITKDEYDQYQMNDFYDLFFDFYIHPMGEHIILIFEMLIFNDYGHTPGRR